MSFVLFLRPVNKHGYIRANRGLCIRMCESFQVVQRGYSKDNVGTIAELC